jgi:cell division protein FtsB
MSRRRKWASLVVGVILLYLFAGGNRGIWQLYKLHQEKQFLTDEIVRLKIDVANYQSEYQTFGKNPISLEKRAREELNLVKPGEIVYKFGSPSR